MISGQFWALAKHFVSLCDFCCLLAFACALAVFYLLLHKRKVDTYVMLLIGSPFKFGFAVSYWAPGEMFWKINFRASAAENILLKVYSFEKINETVTQLFPYFQKGNL